MMHMRVRANPNTRIADEGPRVPPIGYLKLGRIISFKTYGH
jgi:hypothetical protein